MPERASIAPTYDSAKTGPAFTVEVREGNERLSIQPTLDPFINTTVHPRGWRAALAVLRRRYQVSVHVSGDRERLEDVCELDAEYLGRHDSSRRREWNGELNGKLGDFAARLAEHDDA
jgi:hypothetical protein